MRKGSLKLLLSAAVLALGTSVFAASPVLNSLPIVVISDRENQSSTEDWNLFVFTDAFAFADYVTDADTPVSALKWTFDIGAGSTGDLTINDVDPITDSSDDPANPSSPINTAAAATFREIALSPGLSTDPDPTVPFPTPTAITPSQGQAADIDGDGTDDKLVGELVVTLMVADDQNDINEVATGNTFVWTYDTDLYTPGPSDQLLDSGLPFEELELVIGTGTPGPGVPDWFYRSWSGGSGGSALTQNWLTDAVSGTQGGPTPYSAFEITGAGNPAQNGSFGAAYGEWISPGDPASLLAPGKVYSVRAAMGLNGTKTATDQPRIGIQENTTANINQTYVVNAPTTPAGITGDSPFLPAVGSTKQYLSTVDPVDADVADNATTGDGTDLYYLFNFDFVNVISVAVRTASMTSYEVGSGDSAAYNANETAIADYGSGGNGFDDWAQIDPIAPLTLIGGSQLLVNVQSIVPAAGLITITVANQTDGTANISFGEVANFSGAANIDDLEVVEGAAYRSDYSIAMNGGSAPGVSAGNTLGIPSLRLRAATPIPTFSIEYAVNPRNANIFTADDAAATLEMYWTAPTQYPAGTSLGEENDAQVVFGVQDFEWTDGTATLLDLVVYEVNSADPNVDY